MIDSRFREQERSLRTESPSACNQFPETGLSNPTLLFSEAFQRRFKIIPGRYRCINKTGNNFAPDRPAA
jgi:hypothetical protein